LGPTRWSLIATAADLGAGTAQRLAMEELARVYWPALYAYLRRRGHSPQDSEDLVQAFFARLVEKHDLRSVDRARGKFRSFVLAALGHFVSNERDKAGRIKRGGGIKVISLDAADAESRCGIDPADLRTPEQEFNRRWAITVINAAVDQLRAEYRERGRLELFDALQGMLTGESPAKYAELAQQLETTEGALQVWAHRLRKRYRELLRHEIGQTVSDPAQVEQEMRDLMESL
jgi:RNA polymerase sigma-70 factor (ECF subfamily)